MYRVAGWDVLIDLMTQTYSIAIAKRVHSPGKKVQSSTWNTITLRPLAGTLFEWVSCKPPWTFEHQQFGWIHHSKDTWPRFEPEPIDCAVNLHSWQARGHSLSNSSVGSSTFVSSIELANIHGPNASRIVPQGTGPDATDDVVKGPVVRRSQEIDHP